MDKCSTRGPAGEMERQDGDGIMPKKEEEEGGQGRGREAAEEDEG